MDLYALRQEYTRGGLELATMPADPREQFTRWFDQACQAQLLEPNAMVLATVDPSGRPASRTVLLKQYDERGLVFFTNYESAKAEHLAANAHASLLFPWYGLERQVILNGPAERISSAESLRYFLTRPLGSQLGAWASPQSRVITNRALLEMKYEEMKRKFADGRVPLPSFWGGYRVRPRTWEFWQGRQNRLHDRFLYTAREDGGWQLERLAP